MKKFFITGTDTDIGKTFVSIGLLLAQEYKGKQVGYFKPFQSGAKKYQNKIIAPDLFELQKYSNIKSKYSYLFEGEVSPHLASIEANIKVDFEKIKKDLEDFSKDLDITIIEGAGGLYCPAYKNNLFLDFIKNLQNYFNIETIIVTTPSLGRLNHTLMTLELAKINNINIKGLIINSMPDKPNQSEANFIKELKLFSNVNILKTIPKLNHLSKENFIKTFKEINL